MGGVLFERSVGSRVLRSSSLVSGTMFSSWYMSSYTWTFSKGFIFRSFLKSGFTVRKMVFMFMISLSKSCFSLLNCTFIFCEEGGRVSSFRRNF